MKIMLQFVNMTSSNFFDIVLSLVKFSYWSKFYLNIVTSSGVMTIYFYKGLTRNPEIRNTPVWVLPNTGDWGELGGDWGKLGIPNLAQMSLIKLYWMPENVRDTAFTVSELLMENQLEGMVKIAPSPLD